jgi:hypothetical protein
MRSPGRVPAKAGSAAGPRGRDPARGWQPGGKPLVRDRSSLGDFFEADAEYVMQQKCGAFERRESFQRQHKRQCDVDARIFTSSIRLGSRPFFRMPFPKSSHDCMSAGAAANGFSLGVIIVSYSSSLRFPESKTRWG